LIQALLDIRAMGWIANARPGNDGGVGNTLEDLLGIEENNLPLPNASEWEIKCQRADTRSLITLCHLDPSPRAFSLVTQLLLPKYGWPHQKAGTRYPVGEMSFRQTIHAGAHSDRGFTVKVDRAQSRVVVSFDWRMVSERHAEWLETVKSRAGLGDLSPQPYWGIADLYHKIGSKLHNCFFVLADARREGRREYFYYSKIMILQDLNMQRLVDAIEEGAICVDFDARTGHNHGTKFRMQQRYLPTLYGKVTEVDGGVTTDGGACESWAR